MGACIGGYTIGSNVNGSDGGTKRVISTKHEHVNGTKNARRAYTPLLGRHPVRGGRAVAVALRMNDESGRHAGRVCLWAGGQVRISGLVVAGSRSLAGWGCGRCLRVGRSGSCWGAMRVCGQAGRKCSVGRKCPWECGNVTVCGASREGCGRGERGRHRTYCVTGMDERSPWTTGRRGGRSGSRQRAGHRRSDRGGSVRVQRGSSKHVLVVGCRRPSLIRGPVERCNARRQRGSSRTLS